MRLNKLLGLYTWVALFVNIVSLAAQEMKGKVVSIKDGDTIEILFQGKPAKIRLFGIDCPEKQQAYGTKASQYTAKLCFGKVVEVKLHGKDKFRRWLGIVILPDGTNLNELLVRNGYAWRYKHSTDSILLKLQMEASKENRGLWSDPHPVAPWEFRKNNKKAKSN